MTIIQAYNKLFGLSSGNDWIKIPEDIKRVLSLPDGLGVLGGIICTRVSAIGIMRLVNRLNSIMEDK